MSNVNIVLQIYDKSRDHDNNLHINLHTHTHTCFVNHK